MTRDTGGGERPTEDQRMAFDDLALRDIEAVFGKKGRALAAWIGYYLGDLTRVRMHEDLTVQIILAEDAVADPFVRIHEFCHAYHSRYWPHASYCAPVRRTEAAAILAEWRLVRERDLPLGWVEARDQKWAELLVGQKRPAGGPVACYVAELSRAMTIADRVEALKLDDFHDTLGRVIEGEFG